MLASASDLMNLSKKLNYLRKIKINKSKVESKKRVFVSF